MALRYTRGSNIGRDTDCSLICVVFLNPSRLCRHVTSSRPRPLPSKSFPIYREPVNIQFDATQSRQLRELYRRKRITSISLHEDNFENNVLPFFGRPYLLCNTLEHSVNNIAYFNTPKPPICRYYALWSCSGFSVRKETFVQLSSDT